jgi:hypothetical protein
MSNTSECVSCNTSDTSNTCNTSDTSNTCNTSDTSNTCNTSTTCNTSDKSNNTPVKLHTESSLTTPCDRDLTNKWLPDQTTPKLTNDQVTEAMTDLNIKTYASTNYPKVDRVYADSSIPLQHIGLFSFIPAKGATPNDKGVYGFAKLRGNYSTPVEADQRAEYLIRNEDSYHKIFHAYVGRPFPLTESSSFSAETNEIDIRKDMVESVSSSIKAKRDEEQRVTREIKSREQNMQELSMKNMENSKNDVIEEVDPYENYITLRVKKAQLSWNYLEHVKKIAEIKGSIIKTRETLSELEQSHPEFKDTYFKKYMDARKLSGITEQPLEAQDNFIKYMIVDAELDF